MLSRRKIVEKGFTVIELMIVVAIIAIIAAIAIPNLLEARIENSYKIIAKGGTQTAEEKTRLKKYLNDNPDTAEELLGEHGPLPYEWNSVGSDTGSGNCTASKPDENRKIDRVRYEYERQLRVMKQELADQKRGGTTPYTYRINVERTALGWSYFVVRNDGKKISCKDKSQCEEFIVALKEAETRGRNIGAAQK